MYAEYLSVLMDRNAGMASISVESFVEYVEKLTNLHSQIVLTAPKEVVHASKTMFGEALVRGMEKANAKRSGLPIEADKSVMEVFVANKSAVDDFNEINRDYATAYQKLVIAMRCDLVAGTAIDDLSADQVFAKAVLS
ncbi:hypothetical protein [Ruegeria arenilitoris]|uniref:hypothetical protein n=1 Tax=Ruegeria arenilitoris TaxID=1173585 RepID=UPI00147F493F|nr:hypothetical protein [Ruegeria arenilitoris]